MTVYRQFFRFSVIGAFGFLVDVSVLYLLKGLGLDLYTARLVSFLCAATFTWLGNRLFTFRESGLARRASGSEWLFYVAAMTLGGLVNYGVYAALITFVATFGHHPWLAVAAGTGAGLSINFLLARRILYRPGA
mgnify:CR=1 FL=1